MKVVIVGGVAGGATAAARIRRLDESAEIIMFERSGYVSYANCGLPYYIGGVIEEREELTLQSPEGFFERYRIQVKVHHEVVKIDAENKKVIVHDLKNNKAFEESYDKLLLSPGAKPIMPDFLEKDERIFTLRTVEDTFKIDDYMKQNNPKRAIVLGGGFIGIEMADNLRNAGLDVVVIQKIGHVLPTLDEDMASFVHARLRKNGVQLELNTEALKVESDKDITVYCSDNKQFSADVLIVAIGVLPETHLAKDAGLTLGMKGSIVVNDSMQTSNPSIYAVGDAVTIQNIASGQSAYIALAGPANKQARVAADSMCGMDSHYQGSLGTSICKVFDLSVASTGLNERACNELKLPYGKVILSPVAHAGYYPGAKTMTIKVLFEKNNGTLLGAQIVGFDGVDKRIDHFAMAIQMKLKGNQLKDLDLAYAPPYSSAKDPVNMAGFMIENILNGTISQFYYEDLSVLQKAANIQLLDTRTEGEYSRGHVEGFVNIPVDSLRERYSELNKNKPVYVMCQSGLRSYLACRILTQLGYTCFNFAGGYRFYESVSKEKSMATSSYSCGMDKDQ